MVIGFSSYLFSVVAKLNFLIQQEQILLLPSEAVEAHPCRCSRPGWTRPWPTWSWHPCPWQGRWDWVIFGVPPSRSVILWSSGQLAATCSGDSHVLSSSSSPSRGLSTPNTCGSCGNTHLPTRLRPPQLVTPSSAVSSRRLVAFPSSADPHLSLTSVFQIVF